MPNWIYNKLTITGDQSLLQTIIRNHINEEGEFDFNTLIPEPKTQADCPEKYVIHNKEEAQARYLPYEGDRKWFDWYSWHCDKWGVKWNASDTDCYQVNNTIEITFSTPWAAVPLLVRILAKKYNIKIRYYVENEWGESLGVMNVN